MSVILRGVDMPEATLDDQTFEATDRKMFAGNRTIRMIEKTLGVQSNNMSTQRGQFNRRLNDGIIT